MLEIKLEELNPEVYRNQYLFSDYQPYFTRVSIFERFYEIT